MRQLSYAQEQLWFLDQLAPGEATYSTMMLWRLRGPLRVDLLRRGLTLVVARHEALRVTIHDDEGRPYQVVAPAGEVPLPVADLRALPAEERELRVRAEIDALRAEPYRLDSGPLHRFRLLRLADDEYLFCQGFHHIVTDGWSTAVLNAELSAAYRGLYAGVEPVFGERELDYLEFADSQRDRLDAEELAEELAFWRQRLADLPVLRLPADRPRSGDGGYPGETLIATFPDDLRGLIGTLGDEHGASAFMVLAAAFAVVLGRYSGLADIPIGVPMLGRPEPELEAVVGMFINMVVLRADLSGDPAFSELLERVVDGTLELYDHQEVPFTQVVDAVRPERDSDRNPLFQVSLQLLDERNSGEDLDLPEVAAEFVPLSGTTSRFDLAVNLIDTGSALRANVEYASDLFDNWRMTALLGHLETVLRAAAADPSRRLSQLPLLTRAEAEELIAAGRKNTGQIYVVDRALNLVPRGVPGELLAAEGGLDAPGLIDDPFQSGRQVRRTGDLVRWTPDLRIEYLDDGAAEPPQPPAAGSDEPVTPTEETVAGIYGEVLDLPRVGAEDSFFGLGGNSLKAMLAVSRIKKAFGVKVSVRTLYGSATVRTVSAAVDERMAGSSA